FALWPGALVALDDQRVLAIVDRLIVHPGTLNYEEVSTELAIAPAGSTIAQRAGTLFARPEPQFMQAAMVHDGRLYLYACAVSGSCEVTRAPLSSAMQRSAYEFFTATGWSTSLSNLASSVPGSTSGFSVAWNEYLNQFVSALSPGFSSRVLLRTAPSPEGPWSDTSLAISAPSSIYGVYQHPELQQQGGKRIVLTYYRQT